MPSSEHNDTSSYLLEVEGLGQCDACNGNGTQYCHQTMIVRLCTRCDGTGKEYVIQMTSHNGILYGLSSNGKVYEH